MKQNTNLKSFVLAAALALGAAASASAQSANVAVPDTADATTAGGLLGSRYTQIEYNYTDLNGTGPNHAHGFGLTYNQSLTSNLDLSVAYDWARAKYFGARATGQVAEVGATAYTTVQWGRPFATAAIGWDWTKVASIRDDSFQYRVGVGMEFLPAPRLSVTPFANFIRATGYDANEYEYGVSATYRVTNSWSITARGQYESVESGSDSSEYSLGVNYHF